MADRDLSISAASNSANPSWFSRWWAAARTSFTWMFVIAFALRLGYILLGHTYKFKTIDDNFGFGFEMGRIGRSLAEGHGFGSPFSGWTGPTAWEPPVYPLLIAGVFKVFGVYTHASAIVLLALESLFSALTCFPIYLIARRVFGVRVAVWSAWTWVLLPNVIFWCTRWIWETSLAALLLAVIFWLVLAMEERDCLRQWVWFGLLWGAVALINTSLLSFLPVSGLWVWYRRAKRGKKLLVGVALASLVFCACVAPWIVRNYRVFNKSIFIRSNFGAELRLGNGPGADGTWMDYAHPTKNRSELKRYSELSEIAYVAERKREALEYIREDYGRFAWISFKRFVYYWGGLPSPTGSELSGALKNSLYFASTVLAFWGLGRALRRRSPGAWLFFWLVLTYPLVYYFVFPHPRYRHPIEPELGILILYVISEAKPRRA